MDTQAAALDRLRARLRYLVTNAEEFTGTAADAAARTAPLAFEEGGHRFEVQLVVLPVRR